MKPYILVRTIPGSLGTTVILMTLVVGLILLTGNGSVAAVKGRRLALVIGNGDYAVNPIATAVNDAGQVAAVLKQLGYNVFLHENLDREGMQNSVETFQKALAGAETGLFFYTGHGVQYQAANYLVPLGALVESDWQVKEACIGLADVVANVARSGVKTGVFFIDAARAKPLGDRFSPAQSGLAPMSLPDNLHLFLADAPNRLTRQGAAPLPETGSRSAFTATFLALLKDLPAIPIGRFMAQLQLAIAVSSRQDRKPWFRLGQDTAVTLYDDAAIFTKGAANISSDSSLDEARAVMIQLFNVPHVSAADGLIETRQYPWAGNPILVFHTLLRDLKKIEHLKQKNLPENIQQAALSAVTTKYSHLMENEATEMTPGALLQHALTRPWPWPDPFLSPELAAKTISAEAAKAAEALAEENGFDEPETEAVKERVTTQPSLDEDETEALESIEKEPVEIINPAIAQFKAGLILDRQKALLKASGLPAEMKAVALSAANNYAEKIGVSSTSLVTLFQKAMAVYQSQGRVALVINDGETDPDTGTFVEALEESGFTVTSSTSAVGWSKDLTAYAETLQSGDVGLVYVTTDRIGLNVLLDILAPSINALNIVIIDPILSSGDTKRSVEAIDTPPGNAVILFADTPAALKKEDEPDAMEGSPGESPLIPPAGPVLARVLAAHLGKPGQSLSALFQAVHKDVTDTTRAVLKPWWIFGIEAIRHPFQFNDTIRKFHHLLAQLDLFRYLKAANASAKFLDIGWEALVRDHPAWTWFVENGDLGTVLKRAFASDTEDVLHTTALTKGLLPRFTNSHGMTFIYHPGGKFLMGSFPDEVGRTEDEAVVEKSIAKGYYLMQTEVTQAHWQAVMGENPASFDGCGPVCPAESVSWYDAKAFIKRLNGSDLPQADSLPAAFQRRRQEKIGQKPWYVFTSELDRYLKRVGRGDFRYRLPSEAEWEFACRSGRRTMFGFGGELWRLPEYAWFNENAPRSTQPVATKRSNANGFYDLHGNVWEWCLDGQDKFKAIRGGSWYYGGLAARCANRYYVKPTDANYNVGLRLVAAPAPAH